MRTLVKDGLVDNIQNLGYNCIGPKKILAQIETSKIFARQFLDKYDMNEYNPKYKIYSSDLLFKSEDYSNFIDDCVGMYNNFFYPVLFGEIKGPPIWPVIVVSIIVFLLVGEIGSQSCSDGSCNHYKNIIPSKSSDTSSKNIETIMRR